MTHKSCLPRIYPFNEAFPSVEVPNTSWRTLGLVAGSGRSAFGGTAGAVYDELMQLMAAGADSDIEFLGSINNCDAQLAYAV
eukprot:5697965-Amphidinium_carterae.1